jgi:hypothetical protein
MFELYVLACKTSCVLNVHKKREKYFCLYLLQICYNGELLFIIRKYVRIENQKRKIQTNFFILSVKWLYWLFYLTATGIGMMPRRVHNKIGNEINLKNNYIWSWGWIYFDVFLTVELTLDTIYLLFLQIKEQGQGVWRSNN